MPATNSSMRSAEGFIEETEGRPPQLANLVQHPAGEARVIDKIIRELMEVDEEFRRLVDRPSLHFAQGRHSGGGL